MELDWLLAPPLPESMPRQRVLYHRLREAILSGRLAPGTLLPASRRLAVSLKIARNTVLFAYEQLIAEGCLVADRQGTRVAQFVAQPIAPSSNRDMPTALLRLSKRAAAAMQPEPAREAAARHHRPRLRRACGSARVNGRHRRRRRWRRARTAGSGSACPCGRSAWPGRPAIVSLAAA